MLKSARSNYTAGILTILSLFIGVGSCSLFKEKPNEVRSFFTDLESRSYPDYWKGLESVIEGKGHSGRHFSRSNKQHPLGLSYESELPNFIKTKNFALELEFYYRIQEIGSKATMTVSLTFGDSLLYQENFRISCDSAINKWTVFKNRTNFPGNLPPNSVLSVTVRSDGKHILDIDDYKISFNRIGRPSFLISDKKVEENTLFHSFSFRPIYKNRFYTVLYSDDSGDLQVRSINNEKIFSSLKYYIQWVNGKDTACAFADKLVFTPGDKDELLLTGHTPISIYTLKLIVNESSPLIKGESKTVFKDDVQLVRESLILDFSPAISEVYRKNTIIDAKRIRNEYWLDKEGVKIGSQLTAAYIYHNPEVSSVQLSSKLGQLTINLDYYKDHPLIKLSKIDPTHQELKDVSFNIFKSNATHENDFQLFVGFDVGSFPRFMKSPNGYLSSYVLTEEKDCIDLQAKMTNSIGSGNPYVQCNYFDYFGSDTNYYFYGHLIYPYPGFGDFFPTPNYWTNSSFAPDIYSWRSNPFVNHSIKWDSIFSAQRLKDFVVNRGIVFNNCKPDMGRGKEDSVSRAKEFVRIQSKLPDYKNKRLVNFTSVKDIMEYWLALEKIKISLLPDGTFRLYNSSLLDVNGLSLAIKADSVLIDNEPPVISYKDGGDIILWFDLKASKAAVISTK